MSQRILSDFVVSPTDIDNPYAVLVDHSPELVKKVLDNNNHIGQFLYTVFASITNEIMQKKLSIKMVRTSASFISDNQLMIFVDYKKGSDSMELSLLWERNQKIAKVLRENPSVLSLAATVVNLLKGWGERHGIGIEEIVISKVIVPRGVTNIVARVITANDFDYENEQRLKNSEGSIQ